MKPIFYARQSIDSSDVAAVRKILESNFITQGPEVLHFEEAVAAYTGARYAVAVSSASSALHIGALALDLGPGDWLWTTPNTFVASANCGLHCGAQVDFVDIDSRTYNISVEALKIKLHQAEKDGILPKVLVPVHFSGQPCEMLEIKALCEQFNVRILEDASHALGAEYRNTKIGSGAYSDACVFSFHPVKIMTTGEGGMLLTNNSDIYEKLIRLRSHGITKDPEAFINSSAGPWHYEQIDLGFNFRMTDLQAALGLSQLQRITEFLDRRKEIADRYTEQLSQLPIITPFQMASGRSSWHLYVIQPDLSKTSITREVIYHHLREKAIFCQVHYIPVHTHPYYLEMGFKFGDFPESEAYYSRALSIPVYHGLTGSDQSRVIEALWQLFSN